MRTKPIGLNSMLIAKTLPFIPALARYRQKVEHMPRLRESNRRWSSASLPSPPARATRGVVQLAPPPLRSPVASLGLGKPDLERLGAPPDKPDEPLPFFG